MPTFRKVMEIIQANPAILDFEFEPQYIYQPKEYRLVHYPNYPLRLMNVIGTVLEDCVIGFVYYSVHVHNQVVVAEISEDKSEIWLEFEG